MAGVLPVERVLGGEQFLRTASCLLYLDHGTFRQKNLRRP
jgi:hypothetical protein